MFDNLKQHINRENLHAIMKKQRYIQEESLQHQQQQRQQQKIKQSQHINRNTKPTNNNKQELFLISKQSKARKHNHSLSQAQQQDSLSDYEISQRQEIFNILIEDNQQQLQKSPISSYLTPQALFSSSDKIKLRTLQHTIELSQQKLRLTQQYHQKELKQTKNKYDLTVRGLQVEIQKLKLINNILSNKQQRVKQLTKENQNLKQLMNKYQEKYWITEELQKSLSLEEAQNKIMKSEINRLKQQIMISESKKQNKNKNTKLQYQTQKHPSLLSEKSQNLSSLQTQNLIRTQKHTIQSLQKRIKTLQRQSENDNIHYKDAISSLERKLQQTETIIRQKQNQLNQSKNQCRSIKIQKQKVQKSLLDSMNSFSKHLANQSLSTQNIRQFRTNSEYIPDTTQRINKIHQTTINLDEVDEEQSFIKTQNKKDSELIKISPVHHKRVKFQQPPQHKVTKFIDQSSNQQISQLVEIQKRRDRSLSSLQKLQENSTLKQQIQRNIRIMSYQQKPTQRKTQPIQYQNSIFTHQPKVYKRIPNQSPTVHDPQKQSDSRISKLERKLQQANMKIVELLRQKAEVGRRPIQV